MATGRIKTEGSERVRELHAAPRDEAGALVDRELDRGIDELAGLLRPLAVAADANLPGHDGRRRART